MKSWVQDGPKKNVAVALMNSVSGRYLYKTYTRSSSPKFPYSAGRSYWQSIGLGREIILL